MANSFVRYTGNGSTTQYAVNFTYRDQADITVTINGVATTAFTYNASGTQITFNTAPASASAIEIRRTTSQTSRLVDYAAGSVLTENDLDTDSNGRWSVEKFKGLMFQLERDANAIGQKTRRGKGNFIITSADVASALQMAGILDYTPALNNSLNVYDTANTFACVLKGRFKAVSYTHLTLPTTRDV